MKSNSAFQLALLNLTLFTAVFGSADFANAQTLTIWPDLAPGEKSRETGTAQPNRKNEKPPVTRVENIRLPTMTFHPATNPNGASVLILPGGGFGKVVPDKEGTEYAKLLNQKGICAFVLSYRTQAKSDTNGWHKPLQDSQRALSYIRSNAKKWNLDPAKIGLVGFSAGGQVAGRLLCNNSRAYKRIDSVDDITFQPAFAILIYPWNLYDSKKDRLVDGLVVPENCPPAFLVHTDDDRSSSLGAVLFYASLKKHRIPAALHVFENGGHGYGTRPVEGSKISEWTTLSTHWLSETILKQKQ